MFMYFPSNYVWSLAVVATLNNGGFIDEVDRACKPVLQAAMDGDDVGTEQLFASWEAVATRLTLKAEEDESRGHHVGAGETYYRASLYTSQAERLQSPKWVGRNAAYESSVRLLLKHVELSGVPLTRVEVPYEDTSLPAYFYRAPGDGPSPVVIQWNGLDSTKEMMYYSGFPRMLAERGISTLMIDTPGSGEALRLRGLTARHDTEVWAAAIVDWIESNETVLGVDATRIGIVGWSLGGYYAPRALAFEKRLKLGVAWGANHNWTEVQDGRRRREGENPVPHYWDHVFWVWGVDNMQDFIEKTAEMHLNGVADKITAPLFITHGTGDRQISVKYAHETYDQALNSSKRELRIFDDPEGGTEHISIDNMPYVAGIIADWIDETFRELAGSTETAVTR
ncbi:MULTISPECIES: alpha/beta hydrolase [unclassified Leifsonia]|uniref:alpha/beta hydrolase family protein n=1 Tax=unclassified Leifsonia TaxID=2663824 RepID=UPI0008A7FA44|nr:MULTISPECIES: alpha/beta hydrolase [unclassified Leifsonia]SEI14941.1 Alpha/beta hydrolase family protein [Leifsonia sp. CL154]SFM03229.1 Alpha/beta hydrolase family protein [Leifsonia sp. CL147]